MIEQISKVTLPFDSGWVEAEILQKNKLLSFFCGHGLYTILSFIAVDY